MDSQGAALSSSEGTRPGHVETTPEYPSLQASVLWGDGPAEVSL